MNFNAYKMNGLGNDFVIIDQRKDKLDLSKEQVIKICDRSLVKAKALTQG